MKSLKDINWNEEQAELTVLQKNHERVAMNLMLYCRKGKEQCKVCGCGIL